MPRRCGRSARSAAANAPARCRALVDHRDRIATELPAKRRREPSLKVDLAALHAIAERVLHEVLEDLDELVAVAAHDGRAGEPSDLQIAARIRGRTARAYRGT